MTSVAKRKVSACVTATQRGVCESRALEGSLGSMVGDQASYCPWSTTKSTLLPRRTENRSTAPVVSGTKTISNRLVNCLAKFSYFS
jgi:hypothetical protein